MKLDKDIWTYKKTKRTCKEKRWKACERLAFTFEENKEMAKYKRWNIKYTCIANSDYCQNPV